MKRQRLTRKIPTEKPPDPENGSPGTVATGTEAEVQGALVETANGYHKSRASVQSVTLIVYVDQDRGRSVVERDWPHLASRNTGDHVGFCTSRNLPMRVPPAGAAS